MKSIHEVNAKSKWFEINFLDYFLDYILNALRKSMGRMF